MGAAVLPFPQRGGPSRWQVDEIAECYRVIDILSGVGMSVTLEADVSDDGDPWLVFVREDSQDVIIHIARIGGQMVAASVASDSLFRGRSMRDVLQQILQAQPFVLPASRPLGADDRLLMHPATMLVAVVATAFMASQPSIDGDAVFLTADGTSEAEPSSTGRKLAIPLDTSGAGRPAPSGDAHAPYMAAVASAVFAAVAIIAGEQSLRTADIRAEETLTLSFSDQTSEISHTISQILALDVIGIDPDQDPLHRQDVASILTSDSSRAPASELVGAPNAPSSVPVLPETRVADNATTNFSALADLQASSIQLNTQDMAPALTSAAQFLSSSVKAGSGLDGTVMGGAYSPNTSSTMGVAAKSATPTMLPSASASSLQVQGFSDGSSSQQVSAPMVSPPPQAATGSPAPGPSASDSSHQVAGLSAFGMTPSAAPSQAATGFLQASNGAGLTASAVTDFSVLPSDTKSPLIKISVSVLDLFWYGATAMKAAGIEPYSPLHVNDGALSSTNSTVIYRNSNSSGISESKLTIHFQNELVSTENSESAIKNGKTPSEIPSAITNLISDNLPLYEANNTEPLGLNNKTISNMTEPNSQSISIILNLTKGFSSEYTATVNKSSAEISTLATKANADLVANSPSMTPASIDTPAAKSLTAEPPPAGQAPVMTRTADEIVQTMKSIIDFTYDAHHEITLKGQDLEILQILVKANPLIAGADRVLLSHGQILAGDGVMLMPGVALLPAEVFVPKLAASLPTVQQGALEIFFRDDLTVTLVGVIDI